MWLPTFILSEVKVGCVCVWMNVEDKFMYAKLFNNLCLHAQQQYCYRKIFIILLIQWSPIRVQVVFTMHSVRNVKTDQIYSFSLSLPLPLSIRIASNDSTWNFTFDCIAKSFRYIFSKGVCVQNVSIITLFEVSTRHFSLIPVCNILTILIE